MAEEREMVNAGKPDILRSMRDITKEVVGQSWDIDTCNFAYELVIEAIKRTLCQNGRLMIKGFCAFELIWKDQKEIYDPFKHNGELNDIPEHNIVNISATYKFKKELRKLKCKYIKTENFRKPKKNENEEEE